MTPPVPEGVSESLRTLGLDAELAELADLTPRFARIDEADAPHVLARHVATAVERALRQETDVSRRAGPRRPTDGRLRTHRSAGIDRTRRMGTRSRF
jgi:hypothetical protein